VPAERLAVTGQLRAAGDYDVLGRIKRCVPGHVDGSAFDNDQVVGLLAEAINNPAFSNILSNTESENAEQLGALRIGYAAFSP
jgi:hypothetical protein